MKANAELSPKHRLVLALARLLITLRHPLLVARFTRKMGYLPNPAAPQRYNECMLWRRLIDHNPLFVTLSDKLAAKDYISRVCPDLPLPRTLWRGSDPDSIPVALLAGDVVVKANHGCDMNVFVSNGQHDRAAIVRQARRWLARRQGRRNSEWGYWSIVPEILVEEMLPLSGGEIATEIKVQLCSGVVCHVRAEDKKIRMSRLFDPEGNPLPGRDIDYPREDQALPVTARLVDCIRQAVLIAPRIAGDLDYVRVDFLVTDERLFAGEVTVYTAGGYSTWSNPAIMAGIEQHWRLDHADFLRRPHTGFVRLYAEALLAKCGGGDPAPVHSAENRSSSAAGDVQPAA
ncbi:ATP-grasp fold amidoligase family protein [Mesorhizobium sp. B2-3-4]|uniref:ATP-grasp fold amidoligase family protein n=1 Tax=Mesorhizobium sp. B2-3-4 TaxID=2589959 RepID=UPI001FEE71B7|nr:ATP-grasp fold amidoligase family protein [Mesorhizobium sp. B2-3-4]